MHCSWACDKEQTDVGHCVEEMHVLLQKELIRQGVFSRQSDSHHNAVRCSCSFFFVVSGMFISGKKCVRCLLSMGFLYSDQRGTKVIDSVRSKLFLKAVWHKIRN